MSLLTVQAQTLYSRAFGRPQDPPIVFLHGGPGSSSVYFEATTAQQLAQRGFFVIVYDRRGEGRSIDSLARMNFEEAFTDLNQIYQIYKLTKANLIGFSFGGLIATQYAQKYPHMVKAMVLCSALIAQQQSYDTILRTTKAIYEQRNDTTNLQAGIELLSYIAFPNRLTGCSATTPNRQEAHAPFTKHILCLERESINE